MALLLSLGATVLASAQARRWVVDPKTSLAWWQVDPHLNHLWATTCPNDSSWRPGESHSGGWTINPALKALPPLSFKPLSDTIHTPLYPRPVGGVRPVCVEAVRGELSSHDTLTWHDAHAEVTVLADALENGEMMRDVLMRRLMRVHQYPELRFTLDSVGALRREADTLAGTAFGTFEMDGVKKVVEPVVRMFPDGGGMRVLGKFHLPASTLWEDYHYSKYSMQLGVGTGIWHDLFMGVDLVFKPADDTAATSRADSNRTN